MKHPPPQPSGGANTKEEILPQLEKQLEEEAQASASITSSDEDGDDNDDDDDDNDDDNDTGGDTNDGDDEGSSDYAEKLAKASESMLLKTLAEYHNQQRQELQAAQHQHHLPPVGGDSNKLDAADENMKLMKVIVEYAERCASFVSWNGNIENNEQLYLPGVFVSVYGI